MHKGDASKRASYIPINNISRLRSYVILKKLLKKLLMVYDYIEQIRVIGLLFWSGLFPRSSTSTFSQGGAHERRLLVISYYSPPYRSYQGTQRLMKFVKFLTRRGWRITILTSELPENEPRDDCAEPFPPGLRVVRIPPTRLRSSLSGQGMFVPDDFIHWVRPAVVKAMRIIEDERPSAILSTAPPYSNLIVGTICAAQAGIIPHIPDFRDPWTRIDVYWVIKGSLLNWVNKKLEHEVLRRSNHVIMADDLAYLDEFFIGEARSLGVPIVSITNGYDEEDFQSTLAPVGDEGGIFNISYIGGFYDDETFENVLKPIQIWAARHPEDMSQVRFLYAGHSSNYFVRAGTLPFRLEDHGFLSHRDAISLRFQSHVQMFAQPSYFKRHVYSGKIFEMIRTPVPILAITRTDGAVAKLLASTRTGFSVSQGHPEEAAAVLKQLFDYWKAGKQLYNPDCAEVMCYSRSALADRLAEVLDSCATGK